MMGDVGSKDNVVVLKTALLIGAVADGSSYIIKSFLNDRLLTFTAGGDRCRESPPLVNVRKRNKTDF